MWDGVLLGALQGVVEWLPISSEGVVGAVYAFFLDRPISEGVAYALWLHMGTAISALAAFHRTLFGLARDVIRSPKNPPSLFRYLILSTAVSAAIGLPVLLMLNALSGSVGAAAMGVIGLLMLVTGGLQLRMPPDGARRTDEVSAVDALLAGVAQGLAVLPGLSRSGLTVAALLARRIDHKNALRISFLMSVPASIGAGLYAGISNGLYASATALTAMGVAALLGLLTIKALLSVAERVNFAWFVLIMGAAIVASAVWQVLP